MSTRAFRARVSALLAVCASAGLVEHTRAQTLVEYSAEARFQLDLQLPDAAIRSYLPQGFSLAVATQGAAKDANVRVVFIDRMTVNGPDGTPVGRGSSRLVFMIVPVTDPAGQASQLVIGGLTENPADAPGPFGNYLLATTYSMRRTVTSEGSGARLETQDWVFEARTGERLEMHITFEKGVANRPAPREVRFYSAKDPSVVQISREDRVLDILRNVTTNPPDRVKEFSFRGGGGSYSSLFDGTERLLSWDDIIWVNRTIQTP